MNNNLGSLIYTLFNPLLLTTYLAMIFMLSPFGDVINMVYSKEIAFPSLLVILFTSTVFSSFLIAADIAISKNVALTFLYKNKKTIALCMALIPYLLFYFYLRHIVLTEILSDYFLGLTIMSLATIIASRFCDISLYGLGCGALCGGIAIMSVFLSQRFLIVFIAAIVLAGIIGEIEKRRCTPIVYCNSFIVGLTAMALFLGILNI